MTIGRILCRLGFHRMDVESWTSWDGWLKCQRCGRQEPMRGGVLIEWIKYRGRRAKPEGTAKP